jgi:SOS response regulatory protein OraA/RecX
VPDEVVVRAGLALGVRLERPVLRQIRTELQRVGALRVAGRALAHRDVSFRRLEQRFADSGITTGVARSVLENLAEVGIVDDVRTARTRAERLAERGYGDAAILARLEAEGIEEAVARETVSELAPEGERALGIPASRLAARGFSPETIESIVGPLD